MTLFRLSFIKLYDPLRTNIAISFLSLANHNLFGSVTQQTIYRAQHKRRDLQIVKI
jgi:ribosomal protein L9